mgnify:FL=1
MSGYVAAPDEYSKRNESAFRLWAEDELAGTFRKGQDLIIPYGTKLGFAGTNGQQVDFKYDSGSFQIVVDGVTVVSFTSSADFTTLQSEVIAARQGESSLSAKVTLVNTAAVNAGTAAATAQSEVTAARQGEPSLTAKVTQLSSATATVDGKLSASYALTVDVNGRIASMKLLSNGTTSSVKFLASTFQVFNGSTDEAPFTVEGGVVKANKVLAGSVTATEINVTTLSAISANLGTITAGQLNLTSGSYVVRHGAGFGASSDLVMWYGLASVAIGSATKTNGKFALATDGKVYYGGSELNAGGTPMDATAGADGSGAAVAAPGTAQTVFSVVAVGGSGSYTYRWYDVTNPGATLSTSDLYVFTTYFGSPGTAEITVACTVNDGAGRIATAGAYGINAAF